MEGAATFFRGDMLPTNENVVDFVLSISKSNFSLTAAAVHEIWQKADACPMSVKAIKHRYQLLIKECSSFMTKARKQQTPTPSPIQDGQDGALNGQIGTQN